MLDCRDISLMESVPLMWGPVTASPVGIEPMTIFQYITGEFHEFHGLAPQYPL